MSAYWRKHISHGLLILYETTSLWRENVFLQESVASIFRRSIVYYDCSDNLYDCTSHLRISFGERFFFASSVSHIPSICTPIPRRFIVGDVPKLPFLNSNRLDPRVGPWNHPRRLIAPLARLLGLLAVVSKVEFWHFALVSGRDAGWSLGRDSFPLRKWPVIHSLRRTEISSRVRSNAESIKSGPDRHSFCVYIHLPVRENAIGDICAIHARVDAEDWNFMWLRFSSATYRDSWHDNTRMRIGGIRKWWIILSEISPSLTGCMHVHPSCYLL